MADRCPSCGFADIAPIHGRAIRGTTRRRNRKRRERKNFSILKWIQIANPEGFTEEWVYVNTAEEVLVSVTTGRDSTWKVWEKGSARGQYMTKEAAMKRAESLK